MSERLLEAIADREGAALLSSGERLHDVVDPDALDALTRHAGVSIEFDFRGYRVRVDGDGSLELEREQTQ